MQGNIPAILIPHMPGPLPAAAVAASTYSVPDEEMYILKATAGIYPGEVNILYDGQYLSTNPIGINPL